MPGLTIASPVQFPRVMCPAPIKRPLSYLPDGGGRDCLIFMDSETRVGRWGVEHDVNRIRALAESYTFLRLKRPVLSRKQFRRLMGAQSPPLATSPPKEGELQPLPPSPLALP
eukprot:RCo041052